MNNREKLYGIIAEIVEEEAAKYEKKTVGIGESKREHLKNLGYI